MNKYNLSKEELLIAEHIKGIMNVLNIPETADNKDTPERVARMYVRELFANQSKESISLLNKQMTLFDAPKTQKFIHIKNIPFTSICSHHWLPFSGNVDIKYSPDEEILGLSKFPRVVKHFSKKPNIQEELTNEIGEYLVNLLKPKMLTVTLKDVTHSCVSIRGVESECEVDTEYTYSEASVSEMGAF